jgi:hypothetical protein
MITWTIDKGDFTVTFEFKNEKMIKDLKGIMALDVEEEITSLVEQTVCGMLEEKYGVQI